MARMLGRRHRRQCDCKTKAVSGRDEKCNHRYGTKRQRARERQFFRHDMNN